MRLHRFYVSQPLGEEVVIEDVSTIKQWLRVFRYTEGDFVILFNGDGYNYTYQLQKASSTICLLVQTEKFSSYIPQRKSYLFLSSIKKDLFELVVEKATECGVTDIIPIITEHTERKNLNVTRLETIIKEASEQSGRGSLLVLHDTCNLTDALSLISKEGISPKRAFVATLFGENIRQITTETRSGNEDNPPLAFFVGPEGGWSENEEEIFKRKEYTRISLGQTTLRAETAGITCAILASLL